ncbi:peptidoglycan-binding protein LysM [Bifidobacterium dolichotidis]|uniref:Peptidoglycan-binding protein LysM n=1 Tax=Bifidobacterium dolichotidis TaxID=2306976 RepID=A0A430FS51_9BIFI|nr:LysM peptidoglycan-binding domain-containing protein [Bifidobacterium dolichotidis]RSX55688.1 peptidoglycan-binding protein LysM [Bifidobacterium dolichotidis]
MKALPMRVGESQSRTQRSRFTVMEYIAIAVMICAIAFGFNAFVADAEPAHAERATATVSYTVQLGDSLWGIAQQVSDGAEDVSEVVHTIATMNHLPNATIIAGQQLQVPIIEQ